jgi:formate/nitrite transporter FocA (FNT family)
MSEEEKVITERTIERELEEKSFHSVIIKRNDSTLRHPDDIIDKIIEEGAEQVHRKKTSLFLSSLSAGLIMGFAAMAVSFAYVVVPVDLPLVKRLAMALVYPLGFIVVVMSGTQLFTEHTALAVYPFLDKKCSLKEMLRHWSLVLSGNLLGTFIGAGLLYLAVPVTGTEAGYIAVEHHLIHFSWFEIFISAILAGWLMALGGWLVLTTPPSASQILCIYIVTFLIGIGGLHHSIAGSSEIFMAKFLDNSIPISGILKFLTGAITGNLVGGSFFVAVLNYAQIRQSQKLN